MKLREMLKDQIDPMRETLIGREIDVLDKRVLLLGLRETEELEDEEGTGETVVKLTMLYEETSDEDWSEEDEDEEAYEEQTNRQWLVEMMDTNEELSASDIDAFVINGNRYDVSGSEMFFLDELLLEEQWMLVKHFLTRGVVPDIWLEKDMEELAIADHTVAPGILRVDWDADILNVSAEMMELTQEFLVGKVVRCACGHYDVPKGFTIKNPQGLDTNVRIHGLYLHDIWSDAACLDLDFSELEEYCQRDERLLVVEYSSDDEELDLQFYTKDYLDAAAADEEQELPESEFFFAETQGLCVVDVVPADFDEEVEIELLSYTV